MKKGLRQKHPWKNVFNFRMFKSETLTWWKRDCDYYPHKEVWSSWRVGNIDLMKKGLRPLCGAVRWRPAEVIVGNIDLMKKGLRLALNNKVPEQYYTVGNIDLMKKGLRRTLFDICRLDPSFRRKDWPDEKGIATRQLEIPSKPFPAVGNIDLMKKGLRLNILHCDIQCFSIVVGNIDLMKKGLRRIK